MHPRQNFIFPEYPILIFQRIKEVKRGHKMFHKHLQTPINVFPIGSSLQTNTQPSNLTKFDNWFYNYKDPVVTQKKKKIMYQRCNEFHQCIHNLSSIIPEAHSRYLNKNPTKIHHPSRRNNLKSQTHHSE